MDPDAISQEFRNRTARDVRNGLGLPKDTGIDEKKLWALRFNRAKATPEEAQKLKAWMAEHPVVATVAATPTVTAKPTMPPALTTVSVTTEPAIAAPITPTTVTDLGPLSGAQREMLHLLDDLT
ncbi:MAG: hypothetical protein UY96_C0028G0005 [Parcubacteria group bacterium GW2011_GWB1_56_8]|nr:MAG: hypothetical protein UY96_C0028G0005 [Parcubacteria group bacterium GW2011_GWB1_56_8]